MAFYTVKSKKVTKKFQLLRSEVRFRPFLLSILAKFIAPQPKKNLGLLKISLHATASWGCFNTVDRLGGTLIQSVVQEGTSHVVQIEKII